MSAQDDEKSTGSKLWEFLNSSFGLFLLSSVGLSLVTWGYTEVSQSIEQRSVDAEKATRLDTEISYRVRLMDNYFNSDCAEDSLLSLNTFEDIQKIYKADPEFQAIFPENGGKDLHILIWERAALLEAEEKEVFVESFNLLTMDFNAYLTRFMRQTRTSGLMYGEVPDLREWVNELIQKFSTGIHPIFPDLVTPTAPRTVGDRLPDGGVPDRRGAAELARPDGTNGCMDDFLAGLDETIPRERALDQPFLMAFEDVFSPPGRGTMVVGQIERGIVKVGDEVEIVGIRATTTAAITGLEMVGELVAEGRAGDMIGVALRGTRQADIKRGQVLAKPGSITPHTKFEAEVCMLTGEEGGRTAPFFDGYRPQFYFRTTDVTGAAQLPEGVEMVMPGDNVQMKVELITPIAMEDGLRFSIREGGRTVGAGVVQQILN